MQPLPGTPHRAASGGDRPDIGRGAAEQPEAAAPPLGPDPGLRVLHGAHDIGGHGSARSHGWTQKGGEGWKGPLLPLLVDVRHELCYLRVVHRGL